MTTAIAFLLRESVSAVLHILMQPSATEMRRIVREELDRAAVIIMNPLDAYEQEHEVLEPPQA